MAEQGGFGGIFSAKKPTQQQQQDQDDSADVFRDVTRRLRVLEERLATDRKNIQLNQQNVLAANKKVNVEIKNTYTEMSEIKKELAEIKEQLTLVMGELSETTKKEDVKVLEKYIELWEPLNFVTQREVEALVRRVFNEEKK